MEEKEQLLEELEEVRARHMNLDVKNLLILLGILLLLLILIVPKIHLRNNIYFTSRNVHKLQIQHDAMLEENRHLRRQLEDMKFRHLTQELD